MFFITVFRGFDPWKKSYLLRGSEQLQQVDSYYVCLCLKNHLDTMTSKTCKWMELVVSMLESLIHSFKKNANEFRSNQNCTFITVTCSLHMQMNGTCGVCVRTPHSLF